MCRPSSKLTPLNAGELAGPRGDEVACGIEPPTTPTGRLRGPALGELLRRTLLLAGVATGLLAGASATWVRPSTRPARSAC